MDSPIRSCLDVRIFLGGWGFIGENDTLNVGAGDIFFLKRSNWESFSKNNGVSRCKKMKVSNGRGIGHTFRKQKVCYIQHHQSFFSFSFLYSFSMLSPEKLLSFWMFCWC